MNISDLNITSLEYMYSSKDCSIEDHMRRRYAEDINQKNLDNFDAIFIKKFESLTDKKTLNYINKQLSTLKNNLSLLNDNIPEQNTLRNLNNDLDFMERTFSRIELFNEEYVKDIVRSNIEYLTYIDDTFDTQNKDNIKKIEEMVETIPMFLHPIISEINQHMIDIRVELEVEFFNTRKMTYSEKIENLCKELQNKLPNNIESLFNISTIKKTLTSLSQNLLNCYRHAVEHSDEFNTYALSFAKRCERKNKDEKEKEIKENIDILDSVIIANVEISDYRYKNIINFSDRSVLLIDKDNNLIVPLSQTELRPIIEKLSNALVFSKLKNSPMVAKVINMQIGQSLMLDDRLICAHTYASNQDILKAYKFNIVESFENGNLEIVDDRMNALVKDHYIKKYATSIASKKYHHLYDDESYRLFEELKTQGISEQQLQDYVGKKIASFKTSVDFNKYLEKFLNITSDFTPEDYLKKAQDSGATVVLNKDNKLIIKIDNFEQSTLLGSNSWCISRQNHYFESYTNNESTQYFAYDFNLNSTNHLAVIGFTLNKEGELKAAHYKNDDSLSFEDSFLLDLYQKVTEINKLDQPSIKRTLKKNSL